MAGWLKKTHLSVQDLPRSPPSYPEKQKKESKPGFLQYVPLHSFITPGRPILAVMVLQVELFASTRGLIRHSGEDDDVDVFSDDGCVVLGYNVCPVNQ